jgi:fumigallin biosynthesis monooxygenase-like protein
MSTERRTVDLSDYPDLVVITLGMQAHGLRGLRTLRGLRREIRRAVMEQPDGLLHHDTLIVSNWPVHRLLRQYWRDLDSLERWTRSMPHSSWWRRYIRDSGGTSFYHELYARGGGMEGAFADMAGPVGMMHFAPVIPAHGAMFGFRGRLGRSDGHPPLVSESELQPLR